MVKRCLFVLLLLPALLRAQSETPAQANKRLFDRTVDELNFRTFETVYDKTFTRQKFPEGLRTAALRRTFDGFAENPALKQLFLNYNSVAERYKNRFGNGPLTLTEFEKQLNGILRDKNFEFFIHNLPRDERVALIRGEQRYIKQATAQFNASAEPSGSVAEPTSEAETPVSSAPLTTNADAVAPTPPPAAEPRETSVSAPDAASAGLTSPAAGRPAAGRHDWFDYLTLLLSLTSTLLLLYLLTSALPALRRRLTELSGLPEEEAGPGLRARFRRESGSGLEADNYDDEIN